MKIPARLIAALALAFAGLALPAVAQDSPQKKEVLEAMENWKQAVMKKDEAGLKKIFHDDLQYGHSTGEVEDKATTVKRDLAGKGQTTGIDFVDTKITFYGSTAIVTGRNVFHFASAGADRSTSFTALAVWEKERDGWQMLARQVTRTPEPK